MTLLLSSLERASLFGLGALIVALLAQWFLNTRVPAGWRVWIWRVAVLQTVWVLVPLAPLRLAVLPPQQTALETHPVQATPMPVEVPPIPTADTEEFPLPPKADSFTSPAPVMARLTPPNNTQTPEITTPPVRWNWPELLLGVYLAGIAAQVAWGIWSALRVRQTVRACTPINDAVLQARLSELAERFGVRRAPDLLQSPVGGPFLTGLLRPCIVLSQQLLQLDAANVQLNAILTHELAHLKRRDIAWNMVFWGALILFWFHPLSWVARRFHTLEVESACDELVLKTTCITPRSYGQLLLNTLDVRQSPLTAGVGDGFFALKTRLSRLKRAPKSPKRTALLAFGLALAITFCFVIPFRLVARAQNKRQAVQSKNESGISGVVRDQKGRPVSGATVYGFSYYYSDRNYPVYQTVSDSQGRFHFLAKANNSNEVSIFVDAGLRGMGQNSHYPVHSKKFESVVVQITPCVKSHLRFLDPQNRPAANLNIGVTVTFPQASGLAGYLFMPRPVLQRFQMRTNARGEVIVPPLPRDRVAQFYLVNKSGGIKIDSRFAQLSSEGTLRLDSPHPFKTIRLERPVQLTGQVVFDKNGKPAAGASVALWRITAQSERERQPQFQQNNLSLGLFSHGGFTNAQGKFLVKGLQPGRYWVWSRGGKWWPKGWIGQPFQVNLTNSLNHADFALSQLPVVQGTVVSQRTKQPLQSVSLVLYDSFGQSQFKVTNVHGVFQFHTLMGPQRLKVERASFLYPESYAVPAQPTRDFSIQAGQVRNFHFELPDKAAPGQLRRVVAGTVREPSGRPAKGAIVYLIDQDDTDGESYQRMLTDSQGHFRFLLKYSDDWLSHIFVDGGRRGMDGDTVRLSKGAASNTVNLQLRPLFPLKLRLLDPQNRPAPHLNVRVRSLWRDQVSPVLLPRPVWDSLKATTNAQGEAILPSLPKGMLVQFQWEDKMPRPTQVSALSRYAPLAAEDYLRLGDSSAPHVIHLIAPIRLVGKVTLGKERNAKRGTLITIDRLTPDEVRGQAGIGSEPYSILVRVDAQGNYATDGLRPGKYRFYVESYERSKEWVPPRIERELLAPVSRADIVFTRSDLAQKKIVSHE